MQITATFTAENLRALAHAMSPDLAMPEPEEPKPEEPKPDEPKTDTDDSAVADETATQPGAVTINFDASVASLVDKLAEPLNEVHGNYELSTLSAQEAFMVYFKAVLGAAAVLTSPWIFLQLYSFISVGLYAHERRFVNMTLPFSILLFLTGVATCYFMIFPFMLSFFLNANTWMDLQPNLRLSEWIGFSVILMLIFGIMFQLPLLMLMLERVGIVSHEVLAKKRKMAVFVMFIVAAIATPADPTSQVLLAIPMCGLYELGLFLMRYFEKRNPFRRRRSHARRRGRLFLIFTVARNRPKACESYGTCFATSLEAAISS